MHVTYRTPFVIMLTLTLLGQKLFLPACAVMALPLTCARAIIAHSQLLEAFAAYNKSPSAKSTQKLERTFKAAKVAGDTHSGVYKTVKKWSEAMNKVVGAFNKTIEDPTMYKIWDHGGQLVSSIRACVN